MRTKSTVLLKSGIEITLWGEEAEVKPGEGLVKMLYPTEIRIRKNTSQNYLDRETLQEALEQIHQSNHIAKYTFERVEDA